MFSSDKEHASPPQIAEGFPRHTEAHPFCSDTRCSCHDQASLIMPVAQAVQDGLFTSEEATRYILGKQL